MADEALINRRSFAMQRSLNGNTPVAVHGEGLYVTSEDGRKFIDAGMAPTSAALGHCHPKVVEAVRRQIGDLHFVHGSRFTSPPLEALAETLIAGAPAGISRAYFCLSGSAAVEATLKLARQYFVEIGQPQRKRLIGRRHEYHGATLGALSMGGNTARRRMADGLLLDVPLVAPSYSYRHQHEGEPAAAYNARLAAELEAEILRLGPENVIGFMAETVNGTTLGAVPPAPGYFRAMREVCDRHGVLLLLDEVLCGMGYTGTMHACTQDGVVPDLLTIGKGLGAGHQPIAGLLVHDRIVNAVMAGSGGFAHGQTYEGHAVGCAAALAVQQVIAEDGLLEAVQARGRRLETLLHQRFDGHAHVGDIRGRGLLRGIEFVEDKASKKTFDPGRRIWYRVREAAAAKGMLCFGFGGDLDGGGDHILVTPPFIVQDSELEVIVGILGEAVDETFKKIN